MNDMKLVRELLKVPPAPSGRVTATALSLLEAEIAGNDPRPVRTRRAARRWSLGLGGLAAVGVAATVTVALAGAGPATRSPEPTVAAYPGSPPPHAAKLSGDARHMLFPAATIAEREPSAPGKYWHVAFDGVELQTVGDRHTPMSWKAGRDMRSGSTRMRARAGGRWIRLSVPHRRPLMTGPRGSAPDRRPASRS